MLTRKRGPGRPRNPKAKGHSVMVRLDDAERAGLEALVEARNEELHAEGVTVKPPEVLRWLVARELIARGLVPAGGGDKEPPRAR